MKILAPSSEGDSGLFWATAWVNARARSAKTASKLCLMVNPFLGGRYCFEELLTARIVALRMPTGKWWGGRLARSWWVCRASHREKDCAPLGSGILLADPPNKGRSIPPPDSQYRPARISAVIGQAGRYNRSVSFIWR